MARQIEAAYRTQLAKGEVGIQERQKAPTLFEFAKRFRDFIQVRCDAKPNTVVFYKSKLQRLLGFSFPAEARLDRIDEALIERFVSERRRLVEPGTVNRELATLRRMLRLAQEWKLIGRVPRIRLLDGERTRDFVLRSTSGTAVLGEGTAAFEGHRRAHLGNRIPDRRGFDASVGER